MEWNTWLICNLGHVAAQLDKMGHHAHTRQRVVWHYHIPSVNCIPTLVPEVRQQLAAIAMGSKAIQDQKFYSCLHQKEDVNKIMSPPPIPDDQPDFSGTQTQNVGQNLSIFLLIALQNHFNNRKHRFCLQIFTNYSAKTNPSKCTNEERLRVSIQANRINHTLVYLSYNFHYYPKSVTVMTSCSRSMCTQFPCAWAWIGPMQATNTS